jgi:MFS family permease
MPSERLLTPAFLLVAVATLAYFIADGIILPITPRYAEGPLGADPVQVGMVIGAFSVSAILLRPWVGRLADRRGRRLLMIVGAAVFAVSMLGHLVAVNLPLLFGMRLLLGAAEALFFVGALTAISDLAPEGRRGEAISFFSLSLYLGIGIGPLIGEAALGVEERYPLVWLLAAGMAGVACLLALRVTETRIPEPAGVLAAAPYRRLIHPSGLLPGFVLLCGGAAMAGYFAFLPLHALAMGEDGARLYLALFAGIVVISRILGAKLPDRIGARRLSTASMLVSGIGMALMWGWVTPDGLLLGTAVFALGVAFTFPALSSLAVSGVPAAERGAAIATFSAFLDVAFGLGPLSFGVVVALAGFPGGFLFGAILASAGAVVLLVLSRSRG